MDQQLEERLRVYKQENLATPDIVNFVRSILLWLEQTSHHSCTEESVGTLASHLMLALARVSMGEELGSAWDLAVHEEAMSLAPLISWAEHIQHKASQVLGLTLPPEEIDFLLLHLGAFLIRYNDPLLSQENQ